MLNGTEKPIGSWARAARSSASSARVVSPPPRYVHASPKFTKLNCVHAATRADERSSVAPVRSPVAASQISHPRYRLRRGGGGATQQWRALVCLARRMQERARTSIDPDAGARVELDRAAREHDALVVALGDEHDLRGDPRGRRAQRIETQRARSAADGRVDATRRPRADQAHRFARRCPNRAPARARRPPPPPADCDASMSQNPSAANALASVGSSAVRLCDGGTTERGATSRPALASTTAERSTLLRARTTRARTWSRARAPGENSRSSPSRRCHAVSEMQAAQDRGRTSRCRSCRVSAASDRSTPPASVTRNAPTMSRVSSSCTANTSFTSRS